MAPGMRSSTQRATHTGPNRRWTAGRKCLLSSNGILRLPQPASPLNNAMPLAANNQDLAMCSYIVEKTALVGSAKGRKGWMRIDTANVYFDHPYHSTLDHVLAIDFTNEGEGGRDRVAIELSADSARALVERILAALASGELAHGGSAGTAPAATNARAVAL